MLIQQDMQKLAIVQVWDLFSNKVTKPERSLLSLFVAVACFVSVALWPVSHVSSSYHAESVTKHWGVPGNGHVLDQRIGCVQIILRFLTLILMSPVVRLSQVVFLKREDRVHQLLSEYVAVLFNESTIWRLGKEKKVSFVPLMFHGIHG